MGQKCPELFVVEVFKVHPTLLPTPRPSWTPWPLSKIYDVVSCVGYGNSPWLTGWPDSRIIFQQLTLRLLLEFSSIGFPEQIAPLLRNFSWFSSAHRKPQNFFTCLRAPLAFSSLPLFFPPFLHLLVSSFVHPVSCIFPFVSDMRVSY